MEAALVKYAGFLLMAVSLAGLLILIRRFRVKYRAGFSGADKSVRAARAGISHIGERRKSEKIRRIPADGRKLSESDERFLREISDWQVSALKHKR